MLSRRIATASRRSNTQLCTSAARKTTATSIIHPNFSSRQLATTAQLHPTASSLQDGDIAQFFDRPSTSSYHSKLLSLSQRTGLFGQPELSSPQSLNALAERTVKRAQLLVDRLHNARSSRQEMKKVVKNFDRLSDMLCGVIDAAELIRHAHPNHEWVDAANNAYESLCSYMNVLNTDVELYEVIRTVVADAEISSTFTYEQRQTALIFVRDFEKSGIHLPPAARAEYVQLSDAVNTLGRTFSAPSRLPSVYVRSSELHGIPSWIRDQLSRRSTFSGKLKVPPRSYEAAMIERYSPNEDLRHRLHVAESHPEPDKIHALEELLSVRDRLAKLVGKPNFAEWSLEDKMARNSDHVMHFLRALEAHERPLALSEVDRLARAKQGFLNLPELPTVQAWDRDFYSTQLQQQEMARGGGSHSGSSDILFSAGSVFQGLSSLFNSIYGLRLQPVEVKPGETWHPDVQRLDVVDDSGSPVGVIYVDLWARQGKHSGAAHYTVRCSRRMDDDDSEADFALSGHSDFDRAQVQIMESQSSGMTFTQSGKTLRLPIAALVCEFVPPAKSKIATGLTWFEVKTLFHEMGHAIHSMIGRTDYQNVSGTRCTTDFVELPSILMERFLTSPAVLSLFPSSPSAPIPSYADLMRHIRETQPLPAIESHTQILMALLDQVYHSSPSGLSTTAELHKLQDTIGLFPSVPNTAWQTHFTHLFGYGATYYSYLFCRAIAKKVWKTLFEVNPLDRNAGERFKEEVLKYGGGKEPWEMLGSLLNIPELAAGDRKAMELVGKWGVEQ
ncbi:Mitochondrial intermediate peptidase [Tulasnella sp. UAMH 9824]|nr:Mitochondrial intermediate peptidase [Tulasnella sp. UAMH 9824]